MVTPYQSGKTQNDCGNGTAVYGYYNRYDLNRHRLP